MITLEQLHQDIQILSEAERQLIYDFIQLLKKSHTITPSNGSVAEGPSSFLEEAIEFIGCLDDGPGDLATDKKHMEGFGR